LAGPQSRSGSGDEEIGKSPSGKWNPVIHSATNLVIKGSLSAYSVAIYVTFLIVKETNKKTPQSRKIDLKYDIFLFSFALCSIYTIRLKLFLSMKWINRKIRQVIYLCFLYEISDLLNYDISFFDEEACNFDPYSTNVENRVSS